MAWGALFFGLRATKPRLDRFQQFLKAIRSSLHPSRPPAPPGDLDHSKETRWDYPSALVLSTAAGGFPSGGPQLGHAAGLHLWIGMAMGVSSIVLMAQRSDAEAAEFRLGYFPNITHSQALYAKSTGDLAKEMGVPIRWTSFNAGPTAIEAMLTDAIDATFVGPSPAINGFVRSRGEKFVIVCGGASGGAGLVMRQGANVATEKDFGGKVIATPQFGNTQDIAARRWFSERGYRFKEKGGTLTLIPLANPDQLTLFMKGEIDGAWTVEPWLARLEEEGRGVLFLDEKTLWPSGLHATTVLIVNRRFLAANPTLSMKLISGLVNITLRINSDKVAAAKILNAQLKTETGKSLSDLVILKSMGRVDFTWDPVSSSIQKSAEEAFKLGFLPSAPDLRGLFQLQALTATLKERNLPGLAE